MILISVFYFSNLTFGQFCSFSNCDICQNRIKSVRKDQRFICRVCFSKKISIITKGFSCWLKRQLVADDMKELQVGWVKSTFWQFIMWLRIILIKPKFLYIPYFNSLFEVHLPLRYPSKRHEKILPDHQWLLSFLSPA